ncbi:MAG: hypothetical protein GTN80_07310 [Nitrososphaeria archaeon]|nr:hypothetical protein [Nitrososphaeria archaeon]NIQ33433.1 hypothetical protein [Nitrososphaeria archaeon]
MKIDDLLGNAKSVLEKNWRGKHTVPSPTLYPHQWSWDSAFIAMGYTHYALERGCSELDNILNGQWKNCLLPHIIFDPEASGYFPDPNYWKTESHSPKGMLTSGIVQPPVHAIAALKYYHHSRGEKIIRRWFPRLKGFHRYLLENRDPERSGFATIYHPWESGFDNSPRWDEALARIEPRDLPEYKRSDLDHVKKAEERPTKEDYDRYIYLVEILKRFNYEDEEVYKEMPFKIKDVVFNTILYVANKALLELAKILGEENSEILEWIGRQEDRFLKQFCPDPEEGLFYDYDLVLNHFIKRRTVAALIPIYAGIVEKPIIEKTVQWLDHSHFCAKGTCKFPLIPSTSLDSPYFKHITYWRGPIWINTNWMLYQGLRTYHFNEHAERLRKAMLDLVRESGFHEYFDPHNGEGHGSDNFSWTASLTIDLLYKCDLVD